MTIIDPPGGWKYGFPKPIPEERRNDTTNWLIEQGYPKELISEYGEYFFCRYWQEDSHKEQQKELIKEIMDLDAKDGLYDTVNDTVNKMAEESWEGCDGCDEKDKYFWMSGFRAGYFRVIPDEISDEEIEKAWISYKRECLEKFEKDTTIAGYAITNKEKFAKWYREQLKQRK